jgi:plasmid stability protein
METAMADLKVPHLDDRVASALKARARARGTSLEEEIRRTLTGSVAADREELVRRAKALHAAAGGAPGQPELDSARTIRDERDAWG